MGESALGHATLVPRSGNSKRKLAGGRASPAIYPAKKLVLAGSLAELDPESSILEMRASLLGQPHGTSRQGRAEHDFESLHKFAFEAAREAFLMQKRCRSCGRLMNRHFEACPDCRQKQPQLWARTSVAWLLFALLLLAWLAFH